MTLTNDAEHTVNQIITLYAVRPKPAPCYIIRPAIAILIIASMTLVCTHTDKFRALLPTADTATMKATP